MTGPANDCRARQMTVGPEGRLKGTEGRLKDPVNECRARQMSAVLSINSRARQATTLPVKQYPCRALHIPTSPQGVTTGPAITTRACPFACEFHCSSLGALGATILHSQCSPGHVCTEI